MANWPSKGAVSFQKVTFQYRPELPYIFHNLSFEIAGGEKVPGLARTAADPHQKPRHSLARKRSGPRLGRCQRHSTQFQGPRLPLSWGAGFCSPADLECRAGAAEQRRWRGRGPGADRLRVPKTSWRKRLLCNGRG